MCIGVVMRHLGNLSWVVSNKFYICTPDIKEE